MTGPFIDNVTCPAGAIRALTPTREIRDVASDGTPAPGRPRRARAGWLATPSKPAIRAAVVGAPALRRAARVETSVAPTSDATAARCTASICPSYSATSRLSNSSGVSSSMPNAATTSVGKSLVFEVHSTVASAASAAARTWRSSSSGRATSASRRPVPHPARPRPAETRGSLRQPVAGPQSRQSPPRSSSDDP